MLNVLARASVSRLTDPVGGWLVRKGLTANAVTVTGSIGACAVALWFFPRGQLIVGPWVFTVFILFDLLDGAMARAAGGGTPFGAVLDASCDRIVDGALFGSIAWWCFVPAGDRLAGAAALVCAVCAQVTSYVKARAEACGLDGEGGLVERAERFVFALIGAFVQGLGVPHALSVALWLLAVLASVTVGQRLLAVRRSAAVLSSSTPKSATSSTSAKSSKQRAR